jgi:hypothetical protein
MNDIKPIKPCFCIRKDGDCRKCENFDRPAGDPERFVCGWEYEDTHRTKDKED